MNKTIVDCEINRSYLVKKLHTVGALRHRLISFGILKGSKIKYLASTKMNATYEIQVGKMTIALRKDEAMKIEVEEYETN
jgi:Fe2+ transport system protein FeoA